MPNTTRHKRNATSGTPPRANELALGQLAINTGDGRVYTKVDDGVAPERVIEVSTSGLLSNDIENLFPADQPSLNLAFDQSTTLDARVQFTRLSRAPYLNFNGDWTEVRADQPRFVYDIATRTSLGLLIESAATNLFPYSEYLSFTDWTRATSYVISRPSQGVAPDGTQTATRISEDFSNNIHSIFNTFSATNATAYTWSIFVKAEAVTTGTLTLTGSFPADCSCTFDLTAGTVTKAAGASLAEIFTLKNGWFRIAVTATASSTATGTAALRLTRLGAAAYQGDGASALLAWGAQIEATPQSTSYVATPATFQSRASRATYYDTAGTVRTVAVDIARDKAFLPDSSGVMRSAGLLLEPAATNLLANSNVFTDTGNGTGTWLVNAATAPDNTTGAYKWRPVAGFAGRNASSRTLAAPSTSGVHTGSVFVKKDNLRYAMVGWTQVTGPWYAILLDLDTGLVVKTNSVDDPQETGYRIEKFPNGWYRVSVSIRLLSTNAGSSFRIGTTTDADPTFPFGEISYVPANSTNGTLFWGPQVETGPLATSFIYTEETTVTRAADVAISSQVTRPAELAQMDATGLSSWHNPERGTFLTEFRSRGITNSPAFEISDGTTSNRLQVGTSTTTLQLQATKGGTARPTLSGGTITPYARISTGATYSPSTYSLTVNGATPIPGSGDTFIAASRLRLGSNVSNHFSQSTLSRLTYYPVELNPTQLRLLTL